MIEVSSHQIRVDKDGIWYFEDQEIFRSEIVRFFYEKLKQDQLGRYLIELNEERCYIEVEDTPFIIKSIEKSKLETDNQEYIFLYMIDGVMERLEAETLWIGEDNILYCIINKKSLFKARFSRAAYYQIAELIEHEEVTDKYFIILNGKKFYINETI